MFDTLEFVTPAGPTTNPTEPSDIAELSDAAIDDRLRANEIELRRLATERAELITQVERRHLWAAEHHSTLGYLRATLNCSTATARRELRRSRLLAIHPTLAATMAAGHIAPDQLDQITRITANRRIADIVPTIIDVLVDLAEHTSHRQFTDTVTGLIARLDTDGAFDDLHDSIHGRRATVTETGGELFVSAHGGDPLIATQLRTIFDAFTEREHRHDLEHGHERTPAQRRFDALVAIFTSAHAHPSGGTLPTTIVDIVVDARTAHDTLAHAGIILSDRTPLVLDTNGAPEANPSHPSTALLADLVRDPSTFLKRRCHTTSGTPIHPAVLLRALLTEHVRRVVIDSRNVITDLGTTRRLFTGHARTAALLLQPTCVFPGCDIPTRWTQADHNTEHHQHGPTDQRNANAACPRHNRTKHRQRWRTWRDEHGRTYTTRPDGTIILPAGERPPDLTTHQLDERARQRAAQLIKTRATTSSSPDP
ncbi:MAG: hypothetical protein ACO307_11340 [Ilumatobacteraceae bacterium]